MEETSQDRFTRHLVEARARQVAEDTPPLLRPPNEAEHRQLRQLNDALTEAKIAAGDRHAELRIMRVAVEALTARAEKAEARVKEQQAELAEQEAGKLELIRQLFPANKARAKARAILTGADQSPANAALIQSAK